jgi:hypothetical protein
MPYPLRAMELGLIAQGMRHLEFQRDGALLVGGGEGGIPLEVQTGRKRSKQVNVLRQIKDLSCLKNPLVFSRLKTRPSLQFSVAKSSTEITQNTAKFDDFSGVNRITGSKPYLHLAPRYIGCAVKNINSFFYRNRLNTQNLLKKVRFKACRHASKNFI